MAVSCKISACSWLVIVNHCLKVCSEAWFETDSCLKATLECSITLWRVIESFEHQKPQKTSQIILENSKRISHEGLKNMSLPVANAVA